MGSTYCGNAGDLDPELGRIPDNKLTYLRAGRNKQPNQFGCEVRPAVRHATTALCWNA